MCLAIDTPQDFVFASGELKSLRDFCSVAFSSVGLDFRDHVNVERALIVRQPRAIALQGNPAKLMRLTGWRPKIGFEELVSSSCSCRNGSDNVKQPKDLVFLPTLNEAGNIEAMLHEIMRLNS